MKYLTIAVACLLAVSCKQDKKETIKPPHEKTDWAFYKLNSDVQQISIVSEKVDGPIPVYGTEYSTDTNVSMTFNEYGDLISEKKTTGTTPLEENAFEGRNILLSKKQYTGGKIAIILENQWDAAKKNITAAIKHNPDGSPIDQVKNTYINGKVTETVHLNSQGSVISKNTFKYDKKGNLIQEEIYPDGHVLKFSVKYEYDKDNKKVSETRYSAGMLVYKTVYTYHNDLLKTKVTTDSKGKEEYKEEFQYDTKGRVALHKTIEVPLNSTTIENYTYDIAGNTLSWSTAIKGEPSISTENTYDANNNLMGTKTMSDNKVVESRDYRYTYDIHKNWIQKQVSINGKPTYNVTRTITYYSK